MKCDFNFTLKIREGFTEKGILEHDKNKEASQMEQVKWRKNVPGRGNQKCKGPKMVIVKTIRKPVKLSKTE